METQRVVDFPHRSMDKRPRKRPRLAWDMPPAVPPVPPKIFPTIYCGQEFGAVPSYECSSIYYKGLSRNGSPPWRPDDKDGHYVFAIGENITPRYRILSKMGEGTFGQVLECLDNERKALVAIKVVRSIQKYREAAIIEIDVLQKLLRHDIYVMRELRLIHTDLKPENILLVSSEFIKVPDYKKIMGSESSAQYIHKIQHLIEECIVFNMSKEECMDALSKYANIKPVITSTVWNELEKENKEFFESYAKRRDERNASESETSDRIHNLLLDSSKKDNDNN